MFITYILGLQLLRQWDNWKINIPLAPQGCQRAVPRNSRLHSVCRSRVQSVRVQNVPGRRSVCIIDSHMRYSAQHYHYGRTALSEVNICSFFFYVFLLPFRFYFHDITRYPVDWCNTIIIPSYRWREIIVFRSRTVSPFQTV